MGNLLVALMLVIMGQRWEHIGDGFWIAQKCISSGEVSVCTEGPNYYRLVYVIGELNSTNVLCPGAMCPPSVAAVERFTFPVPNVPTVAMTKDEVDKANRGLK